MTEQTMRHIRDTANDLGVPGTTGDWTLCGTYWARPSAGPVADCPRCAELSRHQRKRS